MLAVTGYRSKIVSELRQLLPADEEVIRIEGDAPPLCARYLLCAGLLRPKPVGLQTREEVAESLEVNLARPMRLCEAILNRDAAARICVMGSESGFAGSFDQTYATAKAALHRYVETRRVNQFQQLVCIAPSIIGDAGMTLRRTDKTNLEMREMQHPKRRFLKAVEVAKLIYFLLYTDQGYLSGQVIRMNGGPA